MKITIDLKKTIILTVAFILFTVVGTLSHEYGHIIVAKKLGYNTTLHYGSMDYTSKLHTNEIKEETLIFDSLLITMGGPLQTILTGSFGLILLLYNRKKMSMHGLKITDWFAVFLALFWLREVFNILTAIIGEIIKPNGSYFGGDEKYISEVLNLPIGTTSITLGIVGVLIATFVVFKIVPNKLRLTFMLSGFLGGISGYYLWMKIIGPIVLP